AGRGDAGRRAACPGRAAADAGRGVCGHERGTWDQPPGNKGWVLPLSQLAARKGSSLRKPTYQGTNRRFVVTNRAGAALPPGPTCDAYVERGDSENRNKGSHPGQRSSGPRRPALNNLG